MPTEHAVGQIRLTRGDITMIDIDAFVFYARPDLALGSGFGTAIAVRGGPSVQEQLRAFGTRALGDVVVTTGGNLTARHIVHVVGPRFQAPETEQKLRTVVRRALRTAEEHGIRRIALPAMGAGFYGIPLDLSATVAIGEAQAHLASGSAIEEVVFCLLDSREYKAHETALAKLSVKAAASGATGGAA